jgi:hypothetical protein
VFSGSENERPDYILYYVDSVSLLLSKFDEIRSSNLRSYKSNVVRISRTWKRSPMPDEIDQT